MEARNSSLDLLKFLKGPKGINQEPPCVYAIQKTTEILGVVPNGLAQLASQKGPYAFCIYLLPQLSRDEVSHPP